MNCRGLRDRQKRNTLFHFLKKQKAPIMFLQETHSRIDDENEWQKQFKGNIYFNHNTDRGAGQAILINTKKITVLNHSVTIPGRLQYCTIKINENIIAFVNIYAPNIDSARVKFLETLKK